MPITCTRSRHTIVVLLVIALVTSTYPARAESSSHAHDGWARVRTLTPATELIVTTRSRQPVARYFLEASDVTLTLLNVDIPNLPSRARDVLKNVASTHPEYFEAAKHGRSYAWNGEVRLASDGLFVAGRKIAELDEIIEIWPRGEVLEVRASNRGLSFGEGMRRTLGAVGGGIAGFFGTLVAVSVFVRAGDPHSDPSNAAAILAGPGA